VNLHHYPTDSHIVVLRDNNKEHVLDIATCQLKPVKERSSSSTTLSTLLGCSVPSYLLVLILVFSLDFHLPRRLPSLSLSLNSVFRHARLDHKSQSRVNKLTRDDPLDQFIRVKLPKGVMSS